MKRASLLKESPLRIMHLIGSLRMGGAEKVVLTIIRGADKSRNQYYVLSMAYGPLVNYLDKSVQLIIKPFNRLGTPLWLLNVVREIRSLHIDVLHTHLFTTDVLGRVAGSLAGVPIVVSTFHAPSTWKRSYTLQNMVKKRIDALTANCLADGLTAISETTRQYQIKTGWISPKKISTITNPVLTDLFQADKTVRIEKRRELNIGIEDIVITKVASLYTIKGHKYLLQAIQYITRKHPQVKLLIIGEGPVRSELMQQAISLGVEQKVFFLGLRHDIPDLLRTADIFVMSSLSEGISMAILEAMASGLPIVTTNVGGNGDLIRNGISGILVEPKNDHALAMAICHLIENPLTAKQMGEKAREYVRAHHDARLIARQYEDFYRSLIKQKNFL